MMTFEAIDTKQLYLKECTVCSVIFWKYFEFSPLGIFVGMDE